MILSYTLLSTWSICPHQAARRYLLKDVPVEPTKAMEDGKRVHQSFEDRIRHKVPLPADLEHHEPLVGPLDRCHVAPEQRLGIAKSGAAVDFFAEDVWLRGVLDAPVALAPDTAVLFDWKTGKRREDPFELELGALLLQAANHALTKLYGQYVWLKFGYRGQLHDLSNTHRTWLKVQSFAKDIETQTASGTFLKTPGPLCAWCPVKDCQHNRAAA